MSTPQVVKAKRMLPSIQRTSTRLSSRRRLRLQAIEGGVEPDEGTPLRRHGARRIDRADRAGVDAGAAVDAGVGIDVAHLGVLVRVDAVHRADLHAGLVLGAD